MIWNLNIYFKYQIIKNSKAYLKQFNFLIVIDNTQNRDGFGFKLIVSPFKMVFFIS